MCFIIHRVSLQGFSEGTIKHPQRRHKLKYNPETAVMLVKDLESQIALKRNKIKEKECVTPKNNNQLSRIKGSHRFY